jgi:hypothetical protein
VQSKEIVIIVCETKKISLENKFFLIVLFWAEKKHLIQLYYHDLFITKMSNTNVQILYKIIDCQNNFF